MVTVIDLLDNRANRRVPIDLKVHVRTEGNLPEQTLLSVDWSKRGVFLRTREPLPPGTPVTLGVLVPSEHGLVNFPAVVARAVAECHDTRGRPPGMGVYFDALPAPLAQYLSQISHAARLRAEDDASAAGNQDLVLLVGGSGAERLKASILFDHSGLDVAEAATIAQAEDLVTHGVRPEAVVVFLAETAPMLLAFLDRLHDRIQPRPRSVIVVGDADFDSKAALMHHASLFVRRPVTADKLFGLLGLKTRLRR